MPYCGVHYLNLQSCCTACLFFYPPPPCNSHTLSTALQISYALVQATVGVGTVIIVYVILIAYEM